MSFKENNNFKEFLKIYSSTPERVIFFTGAGMSMPLFPSWSRFLLDMINELDNRGKLGVDKGELDDKIQKGEGFLDIADYCAERLGKSEYRELIEKTFDKEIELEDIPNQYLKLLNIPLKALITTNYDRIPEIGSKGKYSCYNNQNISEALKALEKGKKVILKIHGDVTNQSSIVLTRADYKEIINNNPKVQTALRSLFSTSTICFVGFSLNDPHLDSIIDFLNTINDGNSIIHYAFLTSKTQFELITSEKRLGIRIIPYKPSDATHPEVSEFIASLTPGADSKLNETENYSIDEIISRIKSNFELELNLFTYNIKYVEKNNTLKIDYFTRASTEYENQKEILKLLRQCFFKTEEVETLKINCFVKSQPTNEYVKFSPILFTIVCKYNDLEELIFNKLSENEFWRKLTFFQPFMVGNIHFTNRKVAFPLINI